MNTLAVAHFGIVYDGDNVFNTNTQKALDYWRTQYKWPSNIRVINDKIDTIIQYYTTLKDLEKTKTSVMTKYDPVFHKNDFRLMRNTELLKATTTHLLIIVTKYFKEDGEIRYHSRRRVNFSDDIHHRYETSRGESGDYYRLYLDIKNKAKRNNIIVTEYVCECDY